MDKFYKSFYVRGARPLINWIVVISVLLLFPVRILLEYINSYFGIGVVFSDDILSSLYTPIISLAISIFGIRTYEKLHTKKDIYADYFDNKK